MKLRKYDYFKFTDKDFNSTLDEVNLYQVTGICKNGAITARNVDNGTQSLIYKEMQKKTKQITNPNELIKALSFCDEFKNANIKSETKCVANDVDMINKPPHYTHGMECIDEMILIFGKEIVKAFCMCNAWKYRKRALYKNGEQDMEKSDWYIKKLKELRNEE